MEQQQEVFIFVSKEIQELLVDNEIDIVELLQSEGVDVQGSFARNPATPQTSRSKDVTPILIGSAAVIMSLTPLLSKVIAALSHKRIDVHQMVLVPVEDTHGNVVRTASGEPILQWVKRTYLLESQEKISETTSISLKGPMGIELSYSTSPSDASKEFPESPSSLKLLPNEE